MKDKTATKPIEMRNVEPGASAPIWPCFLKKQLLRFQKLLPGLRQSGREEGRLLVVTGTCGNRVLLCDGKERPLERPKAKNPRHLQKTTVTLDTDTLATNRKLKKALGELMRK